MTNKCKRCGSYAINPRHHGRDDTDLDLCDVCFWRKRAEDWKRLLTQQLNGDITKQIEE